MPVILRVGSYKFFFYSNEGNPREPAHIHVRGGGCEAKFWLHPQIVLAYNIGFSARVLGELLEIVEKNVNLFTEAWNGYFG